VTAGDFRAGFGWLIFFGDWSGEERNRSAAILVLFISSALFWAAFEQAGSSLRLFAERNTDRRVPGFIAAILRQDQFPASWYQFHSASLRDRAGPRFRVASGRR